MFVFMENLIKLLLYLLFLKGFMTDMTDMTGYTQHHITNVFLTYMEKTCLACHKIFGKNGVYGEFYKYLFINNMYKTDLNK